MFGKKSFMNYKRKQLTPDLTPLIDVVFLLLIFFMVATTFNNTKGMKINLPKAEVGESIDTIEKISVLIDENQTIKIKVEAKNKKDIIIDVEKESLKTELNKIVSNASQKDVSILADKKIEYGKIVEIISDVKSAGATGLNIEIEKTN